MPNSQDFWINYAEPIKEIFNLISIIKELVDTYRIKGEKQKQINQLRLRVR